MSNIAYNPRYRVSDYLQWEGDWELWNGHAVAMSPSPARKHQAIARRLVVQLDLQLSDENCSGCHLFYELDWHVDDHTVVRPDILIVCDDSKDDFITTPPTFIAEILSPSTADKDQTAKRALYESQGVKFYLLVDPEANHCDLLVLDANGKYLSCSPTDPIDLHPGCALTIAPGKLW